MSSLQLHFPELTGYGWRHQVFTPFREGVEICRLHNTISSAQDISTSSVADTDDAQPTIALLRYAPGASVPRHRHPGLETILVLAGSQSDEQGRYAEGSLVLNPVGSEHSVWSDEGCVVLIQWDKPVEFV